MEQINNDQTIKEVSAVLGHQVETAPQLDTSKILLVSEVNPKLLRRINIVKRGTFSSSLGGTIYTTPTTSDFYLCSVSISHSKDITSTNTFSGIRVTIDGAVQEIIGLSFITLTVERGDLSLNFTNPIKIDRGTAISVLNTTNVASQKTDACISGYTIN